MAGEIVTLEGAPGEDLRWHLDLGAEPFLSYVPLTFSETNCRRTYRVSVVVGGEIHEVLSHPAAEVSAFAPPTVELELDPFAETSVELRLRLDAEGAACGDTPALWGSPALLSRRKVPAGPGSQKRPNVLLIGLDTVRADALGVYGRTPSPTPALDDLAAESDVWLEAFSSFNVTNPSFASILTGLYGKNHGVYGLRTPLGEEHTTLAEMFARAGYATGAVLSARHLGHRQSGLGQGFADFHLAGRQNAAELSVDRAIDWIAERRRPFFLWLHLFDPHTPHTPPLPYAEGYRPAHAGLRPVRKWLAFLDPGPREYDRRSLGGHRDLYFSEMAYLDRQVGRLLAFLRSRGLLERTLVVLVADHGENLGEHGIFYRHAGLWDTTLHVPLMIRPPGRSTVPGSSARKITGLVQTVDLFPTVLEAAGLEAPPSDGRSLRRTAPRRDRIFAEASQRQGALVRTAHHLLFWAFGDHGGRIDTGPHFYDLRTDPAQERNLAGTGLAEEMRLRKILRAFLDDRREADGPASVPLTREELEQLHSLGYVDP